MTNASDPDRMAATKRRAECEMEEYDAMPRAHRDIVKEFSMTYLGFEPADVRRSFERQLREIEERKLDEAL